MLNIQSGRIFRPQKVVIYGSEGIGKTSLAAQCPDPLFIDTEGGQPGIESFGYGKGYSYLAEEFARLLQGCNEVILSGKNVVITAHAKMRKQELPDEQGAFDRWELKLSKQTAPLIKEWGDALLFLNFETFVVATDANTHKAQGGRRVIYTTHHPCWDAKNRHNLPEKVDLCYASIARIFGGMKNG